MRDKKENFLGFTPFGIVKNRPDALLTASNATCPYCDSSSFRDVGTRSTLVGGGDSVNHVWRERRCQSCGKEYTVESKGGNTWITDRNDKLLKGVPSCFESYVYECNCGGDVRRKAVDKETRKESSWISYKDGKCLNVYVFYCTSCDNTVDSDRSNWRGN